MARTFVFASTQYLSNSNTGSLIGNGGDTSVSIWAYPTATDGNFYMATSLRTSGGGTVYYYISNHNATWLLAMNNGGTGSLNFGPASVTTNAWTHLGFAFNASTSVGYKNGVQADSRTPSANPSISTPIFYIGYDGTAATWAGRLADCATWNVLLTASEFAALANGARPGQIRPKSLTGWWPVDGLESPEPDLSGNANNASLTNAPTIGFGPLMGLFTPRWPMVTPSVTLQGPGWPTPIQVQIQMALSIVH